MGGIFPALSYGFFPREPPRSDGLSTLPIKPKAIFVDTRTSLAPQSLGPLHAALHATSVCGWEAKSADDNQNQNQSNQWLQPNKQPLADPSEPPRGWLGLTSLTSQPLQPLQPPGMTCHHGYTPQHAIFVLLQLAVLATLIASRDAYLEIRVVGSAGSVAAMAYHLFLAAACESPSFSTTLDVYWFSNSLTRLRVLYAFAIRLSLAVAASCCIIKGSGRFKAAKLAAVNMPVLASAFVMWWICSVEGSIEELFPKFTALGVVSAATSCLVIHAATGSRTMTLCAHLLALLIVSGALLRKSYNIPDGSITNDAIHPNWVAPLYFALGNLAHLTAHAAALHATISFSNPQPSPLLPTLGSSLLKAATAALPAQHVIPVLMAAVVFIAMLPSLSNTPLPTRQYTRTACRSPGHAGVVRFLGFFSSGWDGYATRACGNSRTPYCRNRLGSHDA